MLALFATTPGLDRGNLKVCETSLPEPKSGDVLLQVLSSSINHSDILTINGAYPSRTHFPFVPGFEGVARVIRVGKEVDRQLIGQRVIPFKGAGNWQQFRLARPRNCVLIPEWVGTEVANFAYINPMTAVLMIRSVAPPDGSSALLSAPSSAMGGYLSALLSDRGVHVVGLSSSLNSSLTSSLFAGDVVSLADRGWRKNLRSLLPRGADLVLDSVGGEMLQRLHEFASPAASFVQYGLLSGNPQLPQGVFRSFKYFHLRQVMYNLSETEIAAGFDEIFRLFRSGKFSRVDYREISLSSVTEEILSGRWREHPKPLIRSRRI